MHNMSTVLEKPQCELQTSRSIDQPENHQDKDASLDSKCKAIWDTEIGTLRKKPILYREAVVLLLSWDPQADDLNTAGEVKQLQAVFEETFKYRTVQGLLHQDGRPTAQAQVNRYLANFVAEYDDQNCLLIVYYAGHGRPGELTKGLTLTARQKLNQKTDAALSEIIWSSTENIIKDTQSDVLVIFDCCYAGELEKNHRSIPHRRAYEYLAATSADSTTYKPGEKSFTTALIWAMKYLVATEQSFTTQSLINTIITKAPKFPDNQYPRLSAAVPSCPRKITLAPLNRSDELETPPVEAQEEEEVPTIDLSLRFVFNKSAVETIISDLGKKISKFLNKDELKGSTVHWEGLNTHPINQTDSPIANYFAHRWLTQHKRKVIANSLKTEYLELPTTTGENEVNERRKTGNLPTPDREHANSTSNTNKRHKRSASEMDLRTPVNDNSSTDGMSDTPTSLTRPQKKKRIS